MSDDKNPKSSTNTDGPVHISSNALRKFSALAEAIGREEPNHKLRKRIHELASVLSDTTSGPEREMLETLVAKLTELDAEDKKRNQ